MERKELQVERVHGQTFKSRWGQWYRHDKILIDGKELEGSIQVRRKYIRFGRIKRHEVDVLVCFRNGCVIGDDWPWLAKMNGIFVEKDHMGRWFLKAAQPEEVAHASDVSVRLSS